MRVWSWVKGKLMPLYCRAWDPAACFSVYSRHMLLTVGEKWEPEVKLSYLAPAASQGDSVRLKHSGHSHPRREGTKILCHFSRQGVMNERQTETPWDAPSSLSLVTILHCSSLDSGRHRH